MLKVAVQYQINKDEESVKNAHYRLTNPKQQIESEVATQLRKAIDTLDQLDPEYVLCSAVEAIQRHIEVALTGSAMTAPPDLQKEVR